MARLWERIRMAIPKSLKHITPDGEDSFILAYGSNLSQKRMAYRCPDMRVIGVTEIPGYRMLFKHSMTGAYATIEQDANCSVPALVYRVTPEDEARLDRFEGYPRCYYKREFFLPVWKPEGGRLRNRKHCIAYILHEDRELGEPGAEYYSIVKRGYLDWSFDMRILEKALSDSIGNKTAAMWLKRHRKELEIHGEE